ncbi:MAG: TOBE domain-containing protein [Desulfovibrionaceae bacterium]|nr:TOBE domain-containing protein [Desulfovibrionaceae bacterium]
MKYLSAETLSQLDAAWNTWVGQARTRKQKCIRLRLHFIYLLIRHGGLRLGEAIELDEKRDLVFSTSTIRVQGERDIQVPEQVMAALLRIVEDPVVNGLKGGLTHVDPGYVRKNFYMVAENAGVDRSMGGPRVLRHSRGAELLNHGIPVSIVQKFLGLQSPVQAVQLKDFQDGEARQILHAHLRRETLRHTSARNAFAGTITSIAENGTMAEVVLASLSGLEVRATISVESMQSLGLHEGQTVMATVKAPWVVVSRPGTETSCANNFPGRVLFVREDSLMASVRLRLDDGTGMAALMTAEAVRRLDVQVDMPCTVSFAAMAVVLNPA